MRKSKTSCYAKKFSVSASNSAILVKSSSIFGLKSFAKHISSPKQKLGKPNDKFLFNKIEKNIPITTKVRRIIILIFKRFSGVFGKISCSKSVF